MSKRLFLFSIYSRLGTIDDYVLYYLQELCKCGDVIVCADNNNYEQSLIKINQVSNHILHSEGIKHREYDFGSYKRCLLWAEKEGILKDYDWIYVCNDSVFGPLSNLESILKDLENKNQPITCMYYYENSMLPGPQSWFVGFKQKVFINIIAPFLHGVTLQPCKDDVVMKYEHGLGKLINENKLKCSSLVSIEGLNDFFAIEEMMQEYPNYPFIKKRALNYVKGDINQFLRSVIKNNDLYENISSLLSGIYEHEKTFAPKYRGVNISKVSNDEFRLQFVIPAPDPKNVQEQHYFD